MFIGHFALGFASKRIAPELPLAAAFVAAQFLDLLRPLLLLAGAGLLVWLFVLWAWWVDRHRPARAKESA